MNSITAQALLFLYTPKANPRSKIISIRAYKINSEDPKSLIVVNTIIDINFIRLSATADLHALFMHFSAFLLSMTVLHICFNFHYLT